MTEPFSVTYWPGGAQPIPPLDVPEGVHRDGDWLCLVHSYDSRHDVDLPPEFHLRESKDLDLEDLDAVCELVRQFGSPVPVGGGTDDLPGNVAVAIARWAAEHGRRFGEGEPRSSRSADRDMGARR